MNSSLYSVGLKLTSETLGAAAANSLPVFTFILALIFRMEKVDLKKMSGIVKILGVCLCAGGAATIGLYTGPTFKLHHHPFNLHGHDASHRAASSSGKKWIMGVMFTFLSTFCGSFWIVLQNGVLERYPSKLLSTTIQIVISTVQTFVVAVIFERDFDQWKLGWNFQLLAVAYCGIVVTGLGIYLQTWVVQKKGPLFMSIFTPLALIFTMAFSAFLFGAITSLGRKTAPHLTFKSFGMLFAVSFVGMTMNSSLYSVGLKLTSETLGAAAANSLPVFTFILALIFRMEKVDLKKMSGIVKILGVCLCAGGAATIGLYTGPTFKLHHHPFNLHGHDASHRAASSSGKKWIMGVMFTFLSTFCGSFWIVLQNGVLERYPSKLLSTTIQIVISTVQTFVVAVIFERDFDQWKLGWNFQLLAVAYCGIVVTGLGIYLQTWVVQKKGPLFMSIFTPLALIFTMAFSAFLFGAITSLGSILGAVFLIGGLYCVLWGKNKEQKMVANNTSNPTVESEKGSIVGSTEETETLAPRPHHQRSTSLV
ncbi:WAT1-related protein At5g64700-like [Ipomoea triloba]|uniref:WAT1-related protein At5g64700-like n=1 Tax=Ipomoea triloba TaxID=35885 RepID=UPI00125DAB98|nr:WAT1-related protein At5g64700-like [Ipomoea triloba]